MSYRFDGKVCLITGAASGIGRATALKMSSLGAELALSDINEAGLKETQEACKSTSACQHSLQTLNVGDSQMVKSWVETVVLNHERIDHVFNCAGVNPTSYRLEETTDEYWDKLVDTNLKGTYLVTRTVLPHLAAGASIVNVSSTMGINVAATYAIYCATKFGIIGFTKAMAMELGPKQIRVNGVAPGYINTPTNAGILEGPAKVKEQESKIALGRFGTAGEVADVVAFLFSDEAKYMNGSVVEVTGGRT
ncbi:NAD(P)-binding protein [Polychaeton citri CBS 116435]|uniref:NAD(P)-binding protein n=1 Tax=Polychaeton citri CBS 116435 TaxID=1314669 RepID=A0A9P4UPE7_9PEZI|nr:NAD(P)-binding protein [Polychaeton citri CBS 116435]